jgi:hypothetical protein
MSTEERAVPFYCPYCASEDLRPYEDQPGALVPGEERREASTAASRPAEGGFVPGEERREASTAASRPAHGGWECRECTRVFSVKLLGLRVKPRSEVKR